MRRVKLFVFKWQRRTKDERARTWRFKDVSGAFSQDFFKDFNLLNLGRCTRPLSLAPALSSFLEATNSFGA